MTDVSTDVATFLASVPAMGTLNSDIQVGFVDPLATGLPQVCIYVLATGGPGQDNHVGATTSVNHGIRHLRVQVTVRGEPGEYVAAAAKAQAVRNALHLCGISGYMKCEAISEPYPLPPDDLGAYRWVINFMLDQVV